MRSKILTFQCLLFETPSVRPQNRDELKEVHSEKTN